MGLIDSLRAKYELYRLEQRYTKREKRTTFISGAQYVDGEYVYQSPADSPSFSKTGESFRSGGSDGSWGRGFNKRSSRIMIKEVFSGGKEGRRGSGVW